MWTLNLSLTRTSMILWHHNLFGANQGPVYNWQVKCDVGIWSFQCKNNGKWSFQCRRKHLVSMINEMRRNETWTATRSLLNACLSWSFTVKVFRGLKSWTRLFMKFSSVLPELTTEFSLYLKEIRTYFLFPASVFTWYKLSTRFMFICCLDKVSIMYISTALIPSL